MDVICKLLLQSDQKLKECKAYAKHINIEIISLKYEIQNKTKPILFVLASPPKSSVDLLFNNTSLPFLQIAIVKITKS